ncbi:MAG: hypothetical protein ACI9KE_005519 [Polyangiales bacterium]|jgi:hypothetical protein
MAKRFGDKTASLGSPTGRASFSVQNPRTTSFLCHSSDWVTLSRMADLSRVDEELDALGADLDLDAILASVPKFEGLEATDRALEALGENVQLPKAPGVIPPKMSQGEADALTQAAVATDAEEEAPDAGETESSISNFHAGLTPSDVQQLAEMETSEAKSPVDEGSTPLDPAAMAAEIVGAADSEPKDEAPAGVVDSAEEPTEEPAKAESIPAPKNPSVAPVGTAPSVPPVAASVATSTPPTPPSTPPDPIFNEEDLAAIRASTPPPPGAEAEAELEVEVESLEELEMDELDFVEFGDDEMVLSEGDDDTSGENTKQADEDSPAAPTVDGPEGQGSAPEGEDGDEGDEDGEKKGFFKKIFG